MTLNMIGLVVADIKKSVDFYRLLGFTIPEPPAEEDHFEITLDNGLRIAWDTETMIKQLEPHWKRPVGQRISLAFLCDSPAEVNQGFHNVMNGGYKAYRQPWDAFWGQRYAQVVDPDGNIVDLFAWLPKA